MLNTLRDCRDDSVPEILTTAPGLMEKADANGKLLPFPGNTVVFLLDEETKRQLRQLQANLYDRCGDLLAEPLVPDTFHMTLHDLANGALLPQCEQMAGAAKAILDSIRSQPADTLAMKAICTFNMVNTSVVVLLEPVGDNSWNRLDELYLQFQQVRHLPYALTPHITLAYFRPGCYSVQQTQRLQETLGPVELEFQLDTRNLVLQTFDHMNRYHTVY